MCNRYILCLIWKWLRTHYMGSIYIREKAEVVWVIFELYFVASGSCHFTHFGRWSYLHNDFFFPWESQFSTVSTAKNTTSIFTTFLRQYTQPNYLIFTSLSHPIHPVEKMVIRIEPANKAEGRVESTWRLTNLRIA